MDLTKKQTKAIENFAIAAIKFKMVMEKEARKQQNKEPNKHDADLGGELFIKNKKFLFQKCALHQPKKGNRKTLAGRFGIPCAKH